MFIGKQKPNGAISTMIAAHIAPHILGFEKTPQKPPIAKAFAAGGFCTINGWQCYAIKASWMTLTARSESSMSISTEILISLVEII